MFDKPKKMDIFLYPFSNNYLWIYHKTEPHYLIDLRLFLGIQIRPRVDQSSIHNNFQEIVAINYISMRTFVRDQVLFYFDDENDMVDFKKSIEYYVKSIFSSMNVV